MQASEGESESFEGSSDDEERDEEERVGSTAPIVLPTPSATTSSGPSSFASRNEGSAGAKDKENIKAVTIVKGLRLCQVREL